MTAEQGHMKTAALFLGACGFSFFLGAAAAALIIWGIMQNSPTKREAPVQLSQPEPAAQPDRRLAVFLDEREIERRKINDDFGVEIATAAGGLNPASAQAEANKAVAREMKTVFNELEVQDDLQIKLAIDRGDPIDSITEKFIGKQGKNADLAKQPTARLQQLYQEPFLGGRAVQYNPYTGGGR